VYPDIPKDQLDRITPIVEAVLAGVQKQLEALPVDAESSLVFHPEAGE
jgi:hypothetical protein